MNMDSPSKPLAQGCVDTHADVKQTNFRHMIFCLIPSPFFSRRRSNNIRFKALARLFSCWKNISMPAIFSSFFVFGRLNGNGYKTDRCPLFNSISDEMNPPKRRKQDWKGKKAFACAGSAGWKVPQVFVHYFKHHLFSPENTFLGPGFFFSPFWGPLMSYAYLGATI